jgi:hypothetical protein
MRKIISEVFDAAAIVAVVCVMLLAATLVVGAINETFVFFWP